MSYQATHAFTLAAKRTEWAAHTLAAAAGELRRAGERGVPVRTPAQLQAEAERCRELLALIAEDRELAGDERRVRDRL